MSTSNYKNQSLVKNAIILLSLTLSSSIVQADTTITVNWALDEVPNNTRHTCTYQLGSGSVFTPAPDGHCTLRRALREAGARPASDRPITILFNGLNATDDNLDDTQFNGSQWILPISDSSSASNFGLFPNSGAGVEGNVNVSGLPVDVQGNNEMPQIMIETSQWMSIELSDVVIQSIGFFGGTSINVTEQNFTFQNNTWGLDPSGLNVSFSNPDMNIDRLAGLYGVRTTNADNILVQNNIITGASGRAVDVSSGDTNVQILSNWIGTNINGTVPEVSENLKCRTFASDPNLTDIENEWFGGWGIIAVGGTGSLIRDNVIAGLQSIHSAHDTPPDAIEIFGALYTIENNVIGQDVNGDTVGVCGQGILFTNQNSASQNNGHMIIDNVIDSSRGEVDTPNSAMFWSDVSTPDERDGGNTVRGNLVINRIERYYEIGQLLDSAIRNFEPAEITSVNGTLVTGGHNTNNVNGNPSLCPNCLIDFYLDDSDAEEEAFAHLGSTIANADGDFTFNLPSPLTSDFSIRTTSTTQADDVIPNTWAGTTTAMSKVFYGSDVIFKNGFELLKSFEVNH